LAGREITGWKSSLQDIKNAGAQIIDQEVVEGSNLISSHSPADIPALVNTCLKKIG
jgi:protease I